jgi:hypothetical protein
MEPKYLAFRIVVKMEIFNKLKKVEEGLVECLSSESACLASMRP